VVDVRRSGDEVLHQLDGPVPAASTRVRGILDWPRRYALMRAHTALHVLCGVIWPDYGVTSHRGVPSGAEAHVLLLRRAGWEERQRL
jgi:Ser-tRNA(Ala) deacylase AlaX